MADITLDVKDIGLGSGANKIGADRKDFIEFVKDIPKLLTIALITMTPSELAVLRSNIEKSLPADLYDKLKEVKAKHGVN